jgi:hypothetical protein
MRSSRAAVDLIVSHEVTSKAVYERKYQRPEWPGVASGLTVGIGYDLGYNTAEDILHDWSPYLSPAVIRAMQRYAGLKGASAHAHLAEARQSISVPWEAAMAVFMGVSLPKFEAMALRACPGSEKLPAGCFGVIASLTYNRGASFTKARTQNDHQDRYREMRAIRAHIASGMWASVSSDIRAMKRLWPGVSGLLRRRDEEADLWDASLRATQQYSPVVDVTNRIDTGDDKDEGGEQDEGDVLDPVTPEGNPQTINVQPERAEYSLEVELIQRQLIDFKYFEVGDPDGKIGGKFVAGVAAFMTDRGRDPNKGRLTPELKAEIAAAKAEKLPDGRPWSRPIAPSRANATAKDIAPKVESVNQTWYTKLWAYVMGIPAAAIAAFKSIFGDYNDPSSYIYQVKSFFGAIPVEYYAFVAAGIAGIILWQATKAQNATVKSYNEGKIN